MKNRRENTVLESGKSMSEMQCFRSSKYPLSLTQNLTNKLTDSDQVQNMKKLHLCLRNSTQLESSDLEHRVKRCARVSETAQSCQENQNFGLRAFGLSQLLDQRPLKYTFCSTSGPSWSLLLKLKKWSAESLM